MGKGAPPIIPGLKAGDLKGLMGMIQSINGQPLLNMIAGLFPGGGLLAQSANWMLGGPPPTLQAIISAAIQTNPLLSNTLAGSVLVNILSQALSYKRGILLPTLMAQNLGKMFSTFGKGSLTPPMLALKAVSLMFQRLSSPFVMTAPSELQVLLAAFQSITNTANTVLKAPPNPFLQLLQANQQLSNQMMQANQLFNPLLGPAIGSALGAAASTPVGAAAGAALGAAASTPLGGALKATMSALSQMATSPVQTAVQNSYQISPSFMSAEDQLQTALSTTISGKLGGLPMGFLTALPPGKVPFNLPVALAGGISSLLRLLTPSASPLNSLTAAAAQLTSTMLQMPLIPMVPGPLGTLTSPPPPLGAQNPSQVATTMNRFLTRGTPPPSLSPPTISTPPPPQSPFASFPGTAKPSGSS